MCLLFPFLPVPFLLELPARKKTVTYCTTLKNKKKHAAEYCIHRKYINFATYIFLAAMLHILTCHALVGSIMLAHTAHWQNAIMKIHNQKNQHAS